MVPSRIVIAAGGTAGHVVPALAVADALRAERRRGRLRRRRARRGRARAGGRLRAAPHPRRGARPPQPAARGARGALRAARAVAPRARLLRELRPGRGARRRRLRRRAGRRWPRCCGACRSCSTEADSHLGLTNRAARAVRAARLPGVPDRRAATAARYRVTGPAGARRPPTDRAAARARLRDRRGRDVRARVRRLARRALDQPGGGRRRSATRPSACCTSPAQRDYAGAARARRGGPRYDLREYLDLRSFGEALAAADLVVARAGGSVFEIAAARPAGDARALPARDRPTTRRANARWMADAGAAVVDPRRRARRPAAGARGRRAARATAAGSARWRARPPQLARPDAAREVARGGARRGRMRWLSRGLTDRCPARRAAARPAHVAPRRRAGDRGDGQVPTSR